MTRIGLKIFSTKLRLITLLSRPTTCISRPRLRFVEISLKAMAKLMIRPT